MWATERRSPRSTSHSGALGALWLAITAFNLAAATPPIVTEADIERARLQHRMPTEAELARVPVPATPLIDKLPQPVTRPPMDLEAIAKGFDLQAGAPALKSPDGPRVLIFVSFAMPEATLRRLVDQAARAGATLVLRGLVNGSIRDTVIRMQGLIGDRQVAAQIDPQAFDRYGIARTPTFVLVKGGTKSESCTSGACSSQDQFSKVAGDVTLDYAMRQLTSAARGNRGPELARTGQEASSKLGQGP